MTRKLAGEEKALWARVIATVKPLHASAPAVAADAAQLHIQQHSPAKPRPADRPRPPAPPARSAGGTLDSGWDRRLSRGLVQPDMVVDLHGRSLGAAYALLDTRLEQAIASGARVLLLITGKPPQGERWPVARGAIRAAVGDWLGASRHASGIAAVRPAHPRHGGAGALYIVLRRAAVRHRQNS
jgi:DNA-nicking Smr family endonuclease